MTFARHGFWAALPLLALVACQQPEKALVRNVGLDLLDYIEELLGDGDEWGPSAIQRLKAKLEPGRPIERRVAERFESDWSEILQRYALLRQRHRELRDLGEARFEEINRITASITNESLRLEEERKNAAAWQSWLSALEDSSRRLRELELQLQAGEDFAKVLVLAAARGESRQDVAQLEALGRQTQLLLSDLREVVLVGRRLFQNGLGTSGPHSESASERSPATEDLGFARSGGRILPGESLRPVVVETQPPGAEIYLNWDLVGIAPVTLRDRPPTVTIIAVASTGRGALARIGPSTADTVKLTLGQVGQAGVGGKMVVSGDRLPESVLNIVRGELIGAGIVPLGASDTRLFHLEARRARGFGSVPFAVWASIHLGAQSVLELSTSVSAKELSSLERGGGRIRELLQDSWRGHVVLNARLISLSGRGADQTFRSEQHAVGQDSITSIERALMLASQSLGQALSERRIP